MKIIAFGFVILFFSHCSSPEKQNLLDRKLEVIRADIKNRTNNNEIASLSVGVYYRGEDIWKESFGWEDKENGISADINTIYALGSLSKSITGTLVNILSSNGTISLESEVPITSNIGLVKKPTVLQLLRMEGGISHQYKYYKDFDINMIEQDFNDYGFVAFEPGSVHHYSNLSYGLLDQFISVKTGLPTPQVLQDKLFTPLGMMNSFGDKSLIPIGSSLAKGYFDNGELVEPNRFEPRGGAGYYSSVNDLLEYGKFHIYNVDNDSAPVMDEDDFQLMHRTSNEQKNKYYASGWANLPLSVGRNVYLSNGAIAGAATSMIVIPQDELIVVCLSNTSVGNSYVDDIVFEIAGAILPDFRSQLNSLFEEVGPQFEPIEFVAEDREIGKWFCTIEMGNGPIALELEITSSNKIILSINEFNKIELLEISREQGLVIASISGIESIDDMNLDDYYMSLRLQFSEEEGNGVLFINSKEDLPSGLPYWVHLTKVK